MSKTAIKKSRLSKSLVEAKLAAAEAALQIEAQSSDLTPQGSIARDQSVPGSTHPAKASGPKAACRNYCRSCGLEGRYAWAGVIPETHCRIRKAESLATQMRNSEVAGRYS